MSRCPWYISTRAVRRYLEIEDRPVVSDGPGFERAEEELIQMALATMASERVPRHIHQHLLTYRGPKPRRHQLIVSTARRTEGDLPQLVDVVPAHAGLRREAKR